MRTQAGELSRMEGASKFENSPHSRQAAGKSRRMLLLERTMYRDGFSPFTSLFTVKLRGELTEPRLRQSLTQLQLKHPLLRCVVQQGEEAPRFVVLHEPHEVPLRILNRCGDLDWETEARLELLKPFAECGAPLVRMVWIRGEGFHELMLVAHHCICDGPSGITLLRDLFSAYESSGSGMNGYESLGAMEELMPQSLLDNKVFRSRVRRRSALLRLALLVKVRRQGNTGGRLCTSEMYFHRWQLEREEAERLIERCREKRVTVFAAVAVAFLYSFREICGVGSLKHAYTMVNARRFMPGFPRDALFGMAPGVEVAMRQLPRPGAMSAEAFWQSARGIREELTKRVDRMGSRFYEYLAALETLHDRYPRLVADTESAPVVRHLTFSNLGRLDLPEGYRSFQIEQVYSPLVMVSPSPANTIVVSSYGGDMEFSIITDETSLPQAKAKALRDRAMELLRSTANGEGYCVPAVKPKRLRPEGLVQ